MLAVVRSAAVWQLILQSFGAIFQLIFTRKGSRKEENKGFTEAVGRNERLELCGDGAQAHQCDSLLCRQLHKPSGAQPHHRVSYSHYYYDSFFFFLYGYALSFFSSLKLPGFLAGSFVLCHILGVRPNRFFILKSMSGLLVLCRCVAGRRRCSVEVNSNFFG